MPPRPTHRPPQTLAQAKAEFKKHGPRLSTQEARQLDRGAELFRRAETIRQNVKKRLLAKKRKTEREDRERDARRRLNIASQKPAVPRSQCLLEGFVKVSKMPINGVGEVREVGGTGRPEPWGEEGEELEDGEMLDTVAPNANVKMESAGPLTADDLWDDFIFSATQVERELSSPLQLDTSDLASAAAPDPFLAMLSTQDVTMCFDELDEQPLSQQLSLSMGMYGATARSNANTPAVQSTSSKLSTPEEVISTQDLLDSFETLLGTSETVSTTAKTPAHRSSRTVTKTPIITPTSATTPTPVKEHTSSPLPHAQSQKTPCPKGRTTLLRSVLDRKLMPPPPLPKKAAPPLPPPPPQPSSESDDLMFDDALLLSTQDLQAVKMPCANDHPTIDRPTTDRPKIDEFMLSTQDLRGVNIGCANDRGMIDDFMLSTQDFMGLAF